MFSMNELLMPSDTGPESNTERRFLFAPGLCLASLERVTG